MLGQAQIAVVVPAYNESLLIVRTLRGVPRFVDRIVVVDDGSRDATAALALREADPRIVVVRHAQNRGVGAALKTGYARAFADGADIVAVMAGDGQMDPADLRPLLRPIVQGLAEYCKGDRLSHPDVRAQMPTLRYVGNHLLSALTRLSTGTAVRDSQCGYTALSRTAFCRLPLNKLWEGYGYPNDLLGWLTLGRMHVAEVAVRPLYGLETSGIGLRHALFVIPFVLLRVALRRVVSAVARKRRPREASATVEPATALRPSSREGNEGPGNFDHPLIGRPLA